MTLLWILWSSLSTYSSLWGNRNGEHSCCFIVSLWGPRGTSLGGGVCLLWFHFHFTTGCQFSLDGCRWGTCLLSKGVATNHLTSLSRSSPLLNSENSVQATDGESHAFLPKLLTDVPNIIVSVPSSFLTLPSCLLEQSQVMAWIEKSQEKHVNFSLIPRQRIFQ